MEQSLISNPIIRATLLDYPKAQWKRVIVAIALYGIQSLKKNYHSSNLSVEQLESICGLHSKKTTGMTMFMNELKNIKREIVKLDKKIDQSANTINKENIHPNKGYHYDNKRSTSQPTSKKVEIKPHAIRKPLGLCRTKNENEGKSTLAKPNSIYPSWWPKTTRPEELNYENVRAKNMIPTVREIRKQTIQQANRTIYQHPKKTEKTNQTAHIVPSYLKNVQSRILGNIEKDKMEYKIRKTQKANPRIQVDQNEIIGSNTMEAADRYLDNSIINHFTKVGNQNIPSESYSNSPSQNQSPQLESNRSEQMPYSSEDRQGNIISDSDKQQSYKYNSSYAEELKRSNWEARHIGEESRKHQIDSSVEPER